ncbi:MAG: hypothetical protein MUF49_25500 [Oculatellaceae cyanobacterium Prado106]|jgi:nickel transport protein|nr:hypothetical protein [Oculatellaceae cyanobacterium Prado106]
MKSLIRWGAALSLVGGILFSPLSIMGNTRVLALTNEQVVERLNTVPVFTFLDSERNFLVTRPTQGGENALPVVYMFVSQESAQAALNDLKQSNPEQANGFQVTPVPLSLAYQMARRDENQENPVQVAFIAAQAQVNAARTLLQQSGQNAEQFQGVPLFIPRSTEQEGVYLTVRRDEQEVIPIYFSQEDAQAMIEQVSRSQPELANKVGIQVISLEGLIQNLQNSDNEALNQIYLFPSQETRNFIRTLQQQAQPGQQPAQGQPNRQQSQNRQPRPNPAPQNNQQPNPQAAPRQ